MSAVAVMYQTFPSGFQTYPRPACSTEFAHGQGFQRMHEPLDLGPSTSLSLPSSSSSSSSSSLSLSYTTSALLSPPSSSGPPSGSAIGACASPPLSSSTSSSSTLLLKDDATNNDRPPEPKGAHFLTSNCVLFTYFHGDTAAEVDEHFSRALSSTSSFSDPGSGSGRSPTSGKSPLHRAPTPMSARNLPASFWNSAPTHPHHHHHHQHHSNNSSGGSSFIGHHHHHPHHPLQQQQYNHHPHHPHFPTTAATSGGVGMPNACSSEAGSSLQTGPHHPYFPSPLHSFTNLQTDPWTYGFSPAASSMPYPHRPVPYDLGYPSSSRLSQNYSSLLMQPSAVRSAQLGSMTGHCDVSKANTDHSRTRYSDHRLGPEYPSNTFTALEAAGLQEAAKDLYWF